MANAKQTRRYETQKNQREARDAGTPHPRGLARSIAKQYCRAKSIPESECGTYFRDVIKALPKTGRKYSENVKPAEAERRLRRVLK